MITRSGRVVFAALLACAAATIAVAEPVEGRFRLVEQRYEAGAVNLATQDPALHVEWSRAGGRLEGRIWAGDDPAGAVSWPAYRNDSGPLPVRVLERSEDAVRGEIVVRYRVTPSASDDLELEVTESYRLADGGVTLEGTMTVRFAGGTTNRGGFTLHRRFERER